LFKIIGFNAPEKPVTSACNDEQQVCAYLQPGPSRATVGLGETFSRGPQTFCGVPLGRKFLNFSFENGAFWCTLYF